MMNAINRREYLARMGAAAAITGTSSGSVSAPQSTKTEPPVSPEEQADRARRMKWWHAAKFGMFIHWGLYSVLGRHEWVMENEGFSVPDYEKFADQFKPKPQAARDWAKLAKAAGMKYMVMTTKHHEGFCLFSSRLTGYCAAKRAAGRDLVQEYVEAARSEGLRVGFYYSLMDWHHPDGARCAEDEAARRRFVDYIHGQIRELMTLYGKIDILWYDVSWPLNAAGWESNKMNKMVFQLQPDIIVNNRNQLPGDFATPEQRITAEASGRAWEACMTMNDSWGYHAADDAWKTPKQVIRNLATCARDSGNYLLNIGPKPDGSIPQESISILQAVGRWTEKNGASVYETDRCQVRRSNYCNFTRRGNTLYIHVHFWPGNTVTVAGLNCKVLSARLLADQRKVNFEQDALKVRFIGLPEKAPDPFVTVIVAECDQEPAQDMDRVRKQHPRGTV